MTEHGQVVDGEYQGRPNHGWNGKTRSVKDVQVLQFLPRISCDPHPLRQAAKGFFNSCRQS